MKITITLTLNEQSENIVVETSAESKTEASGVSDANQLTKTDNKIIQAIQQQQQSLTSKLSQNQNNKLILFLKKFNVALLIELAIKLDILIINASDASITIDLQKIIEAFADLSREIDEECLSTKHQRCLSITANLLARYADSKLASQDLQLIEQGEFGFQQKKHAWTGKSRQDLRLAWAMSEGSQLLQQDRFSVDEVLLSTELLAALKPEDVSKAMLQAATDLQDLVQDFVQENDGGATQANVLRFKNYVMGAYLGDSPFYLVYVTLKNEVHVLSLNAVHNPNVNVLEAANYYCNNNESLEVVGDSFRIDGLLVSRSLGDQECKHLIRKPHGFMHQLREDVQQVVLVGGSDGLSDAFNSSHIKKVSQQILDEKKKLDINILRNTLAYHSQLSLTGKHVDNTTIVVVDFEVDQSNRQTTQAKMAKLPLIAIYDGHDFFGEYVARAGLTRFRQSFLQNLYSQIQSRELCRYALSRQVLPTKKEQKEETKESSEASTAATGKDESESLLSATRSKETSYVLLLLMQNQVYPQIALPRWFLCCTRTAYEEKPPRIGIDSEGEVRDENNFQAASTRYSTFFNTDGQAEKEASSSKRSSCCIL